MDRRHGEDLKMSGGGATPVVNACVCACMCIVHYKKVDKSISR